ncbi:hypothetical protein B0T25DRAFT_565413 [Lasiosphaeria hispida]|uniref:Rieske domain-containing protein n=1 Tax=Lasiosphaeria hispida TaxID=260671 RepID=A0AAJ0MIZ0_9PEZI|nr:hypothetical protein B0T25DRAFT_565413 [Lasiosphaeria hispida]
MKLDLWEEEEKNENEDGARGDGGGNKRAEKEETDMAKAASKDDFKCVICDISVNSRGSLTGHYTQGRIRESSGLYLKGVVCWNAAEKSFDCPVHGSRFSSEGIGVSGPAKANLGPVDHPGKIAQEA